MKVSYFLKHLFIPHHGNDYKPHFFRELSIAIILIVIIFLLGVSFGRYYFVNKTVLGASIVIPVLIDLTNEDRLAYNKKPLIRSEKLDEAAMLKAEDMTNLGYFSHNSPTGITPWHWFSKVGYKFLYAGENLAINFTDTKSVEEAWFSSPAHRANLLNVNFQDIGLATKEGIYNGNPTIFIVQMFGTPKQTTTRREEISTTSLIVAKTNIESENISSTTTSVGEVKGFSSNADDIIEYIAMSDGLVVAKSFSEETKHQDVSSRIVTYSKWYERLLFNGSGYINLIYKILLIIIAIALLTMFFVEITKQHWKHLAYGLATTFILISFIFINNFL